MKMRLAWKTVVLRLRFRITQNGESRRGRLPQWRKSTTDPSAATPLGGFMTRAWLRFRVVAFMALTAAPATAQTDSYDPSGSGPIVAAVHWLQGTLLGTVATVVAAMAVASVGFMMLTGRMNWRYGATVILGCFILFGAASSVGGIKSTMAGG